MYLDDDQNTSRHVPYKKVLRDNEDDTPIGLTPQAFEMREWLGEKALSMNWLEYFGKDHETNIVEMINDFRESRRAQEKKVGLNSIFGIGNVGKLQSVCANLQHSKVKVLFEENKRKVHNKSHSTIIRLPMNDDLVMQALAAEVFTEIIANKDVPAL